MLAALALLVVLAGCGGEFHGVRGYGMKLELPSGWTGEVYRRGNGLVILHAASFRLGPHRGYDPLGTIERGDRLVDARYGLRRGDAGIGVFAYSDVPGPPAPELRGDLSVRASDRKAMEGYPAGKATYARTFSAGGRDVQVVVEFGSDQPSASLLAKVNDVLGTLSVGPE